MYFFCFFFKPGTLAYHLMHLFSFIHHGHKYGAKYTHYIVSFCRVHLFSVQLQFYCSAIDNCHPVPKPMNHVRSVQTHTHIFYMFAFHYLVGLISLTPSTWLMLCNVKCLHKQYRQMSCEWNWNSHEEKRQQRTTTTNQQQRIRSNCNIDREANKMLLSFDT